MNILSWIIFGFLAGALAQKIMPGDDPGSLKDIEGVSITIGIGIAGAIIGGLLGTLLGMGGISSFSMRSFALAIIGALIFLYGYKRYKTEN